MGSVIATWVGWPAVHPDTCGVTHRLTWPIHRSGSPVPNLANPDGGKYPSRSMYARLRNGKLTMTRLGPPRSLALALGAVVSCLIHSAATSAATNGPDAAPLSSVDNRVFTHVDVDGQGLFDFLVDTGASRTCVSPDRGVSSAFRSATSLAIGTGRLTPPWSCRAATSSAGTPDAVEWSADGSYATTPSRRMTTGCGRRTLGC